MGTAETGSGKTLAFGLPILHRLLERRQILGLGKAEPVLTEASEAESQPQKRQRVQHSSGSDEESTNGEQEPEGETKVQTITDKRWSTLPALIISPTRELALQVVISGILSISSFNEASMLFPRSATICKPSRRVLEFG